MINHIAGIGAKAPADPFQSFSVEFNDALGGGKAEGLGGAQSPVAGFGDVLNQAIQHVEATHAHAENLAFDFATGKPVDIHTMMIALAKADVTMQVASSVVSKTAQGLNTLLQTQV